MTKNKGIKAADSLMRKLMQVPKSESVDKHKQPSLPYQSRLAGIVPRFTGGGGLFS